MKKEWHCRQLRLKYAEIEVEYELGFGYTRRVGRFGKYKINPAVEMNLYIRL